MQYKIVRINTYAKPTLYQTDKTERGWEIIEAYHTDLNDAYSDIMTDLCYSPAHWYEIVEEHPK